MQTPFGTADNQWKGDKYVGEYGNNKRHGQGTYTFTNGTVVEGVWDDDNFLGEHGGDKTITADLFWGTWTQNWGNCVSTGNNYLFRFDENASYFMVDGTVLTTTKHSISINNGMIVVKEGDGYVNAYKVLSDNEIQLVYTRLKEFDSWVEKCDGLGWAGPMYYRCSH